MMETKTYNWEIVRFRDCVSYSGTGLDAIKRAPLFDYDTGIRCIRIQDLSQNKPFHEWAFTKTSDKDYKKYQLKKDDILLARTGATIGVSYKIQETLNAVHNNGTIKFRFNSKVDVTFMYGLMQTESFLQYVDNISCVATQPNLRIDVLQKFQFLLPPLPTQRRIASILSTYDALIQNYKRQIAALQSAASELYKEWFVRFRFPCYKNAKFDNGLPVGWKVASAKDIGEFVRGKNITADEMIKGNIPVISAGIEPSGYHNKANVNGVSLTISNSGANAGFLMINYSSIWAADCSYCNTAKSIYFYYEMLNNMRVALFNLQQGSAQPHVYAKDINKLKVLLPTKDLIAKADSAIKSFHNKIYLLQQQITNLTTQRDLLLPRLMSGKLSVE